MNSSQLKKEHSFMDFLYCILTLAVPLITALIGIFINSVLWFVIYILICLVLMILLMKYICSHCPYYNKSGTKVKCRFYWFMPKFFSPKEEPLSNKMKFLPYLATAIIFLLPLIWLVQEPSLLIIYILSAAVFLLGVRRHECCYCLFFECPSNTVSFQVQEDYKKGSESQ